jgi:hypothetical protein
MVWTIVTSLIPWCIFVGCSAETLVREDRAWEKNQAVHNAEAVSVTCQDGVTPTFWKMVTNNALPKPCRCANYQIACESMMEDYPASYIGPYGCTREALYKKNAGPKTFVKRCDSLTKDTCTQHYSRTRTGEGVACYWNDIPAILYNERVIAKAAYAKMSQYDQVGSGQRVTPPTDKKSKIKVVPNILALEPVQKCLDHKLVLRAVHVSTWQSPYHWLYSANPREDFSREKWKKFGRLSPDGRQLFFDGPTENGDGAIENGAQREEWWEKNEANDTWHKVTEKVRGYGIYARIPYAGYTGGVLDKVTRPRSFSLQKYQTFCVEETPANCDSCTESGTGKNWSMYTRLARPWKEENISSSYYWM